MLVGPFFYKKKYVDETKYYRNKDSNISNPMVILKPLRILEINDNELTVNTSDYTCRELSCQAKIGLSSHSTFMTILYIYSIFQNFETILHLR